MTVFSCNCGAIVHICLGSLQVLVEIIGSLGGRIGAGLVDGRPHICWDPWLTRADRHRDGEGGLGRNDAGPSATEQARDPSVVCFGGLNTNAVLLAIGSMDPFLGSALIGPGLWHATIGWTRDTGSLLDALFLPTRF